MSSDVSRPLPLPGRWKSPRLSLLLGLFVLLSGALFLLARSAHHGALVDDAYISFRYAARWAAGKGWTWNDGTAVEGFSNPLWTLILGGLDRVGGITPDRLAPWLGLGFLTGTVVLLVVLARARGLEGWARLILIGGCALDAGLALWAGSGLETSLAAFAVAATLAAASRRPSSFRVGVLLGLCGAAMALSRPEGGMWTLWLGIWLVWGVWAPGRALAGWVVGMIPAAAYLVFRWTTFGAMVPNTFYAKLEPTFLGVPYGLAALGGWGLAHAVPLALGVGGWGRRIFRRGSVARLAPMRWMLLPAGFVGGEALFVVVAGGDWMGKMRYLAPVLPAFYLLVAEAWRGAAPVRGWRPVVAAGLVLAGHAALGWSRLDPIPTYTRQGEELGRWLARVAAPGDTVAVTAAGAIPYFSGLPAIDVLGINDPGVASRAPRHTGSWAPGHHRYNLDEALGLRPAWIVWDFGVTVNRYRMRRLDEDTSPRGPLDFRRALLADPRFRTNYTIEDAAPEATQRAYTVFRRRGAGEGSD